SRPAAQRPTCPLRFPQSNPPPAPGRWTPLGASSPPRRCETPTSRSKTFVPSPTTPPNREPMRQTCHVLTSYCQGANLRPLHWLGSSGRSLMACDVLPRPEVLG